jgi:uncharacterized membrane protein YphA (DoxX/SURF4 family)
VCEERFLNAMARYYPGFLGALALILLRVAIGWHFLTEGVEKYESYRYGKNPFSAEIYLRNATGPLGPYFRGMIPDVNGLALLDPPRLKASWRNDVEWLAEHLKFDDKKRRQAAELADDAETWADHWFSNPDNAEKREKYYHDLRSVLEIENDLHALSYERERASEARRTLDADRRALTGPLIEREEALRAAVAGLASPDQLPPGGEVPRPWSELDLINVATTCGLIAIGICLILGFMTPLAALGAAAFLALIYLSMPPWPGLPPNPRAEGHYFIVSKNLVELIACLVIATTPSGRWIGFDALVFGGRKRAAAASESGRDRATSRAPNDDRPETTSQADREPIPIG